MADLVLTSAEIDAWAESSDISDEFLEMASDPDSNDGLICLLEINHEDLTEAIRVCSAPLEFFYFHPETREPVHGITFKGVPYLWCSFSFILPEDPETGALGSARISIENVDPIMTATLRQIQIAPNVEATIIRKSEPDRAEMTFSNMKLVNATVDVQSIAGQLSDYNFLSEILPQDKYLPSIFRGLFK